ncbi:MAG: maleylacetate reductase [Acidimicrobiia bacterium]|nr:maleylacetate reductase [Acidimicrobiia bacterium]
MTASWVHTAYPQQVRFGTGLAERLRPLLKEAGSTKVLLLGSSRAISSELGQKVLAGLGRGVGVAFDQASPGVPASTVQAATRTALSEVVDTVVSFGGGSTVDLGKAIAFFLEQQAGTPGTSFADRPAVTHIAVPTTFTGAEGSTHFAMTDPTARAAQVAESPTLAPRWVVYDPACVAGLPAPLVATTGLVALSHAADAALAQLRSPEAEALALAAFGRVYGSLVPAVEGDPDARTSLLEGSALAARAWQQALPGLTHGLGLLLAGRARLPYATAVAMLASPVMQFNAEALGPRLEQLARAVGSSDLPATVAELTEEVGVGNSLSDLGLGDEDASAIARMAQANPFCQANRRRALEEDVVELLYRIW